MIDKSIKRKGVVMVEMPDVFYQKYFWFTFSGVFSALMQVLISYKSQKAKRAQ